MCIVGCGRSHRRDDQIGLRVAEVLERNPPPQTAVRASQAPGRELIGGMEGVRLLVVADAALATPEFPVGDSVRHDYLDPVSKAAAPRLTPPQAAQGDPSHLLGVNYALKLGRDLNLLPEHVWVYTVAGKDFGYGERVSPGIDAAIESVAERIRSDVATWLRHQESKHA